MQSYTNEFKLIVVKDFLKTNHELKKITNKYHISKGSITNWVQLYEIFGEEYFLREPPIKIEYSNYLKLTVIHEFLNTEIDKKSLLKKYNIYSSDNFNFWLKKYKQFGDTYFETNDNDIFNDKYSLMKPKLIYKEDIENFEEIMDNGMRCRVIKYRTCADIDVQFEDGVIIEHIPFYKLKNKSVKHPLINERCTISRNEFLMQKIFEPYGFKKINCGELQHLGLKNLELDLYNDNFCGYKIGIEYDGFYMKQKKVGHTIKKDKYKDMLCRKANIILIRIREPQLPQLNSSSICFYCNSNESFSDDLIRTINDVINYLNNKFYSKIKEIKEIKDIDFEQISEEFMINCKQKYRMRLHEKRKMNNGQTAEIIAYYSTKNITLKFEDETIVYNKDYHSFEIGNISNPNFDKLKQERLHEKRKMNNGQMAEIIAYKKQDNITIQFEDGTIVYNKKYSCFKRGSILNPNIKVNNKYIQSRLHEKQIMNNGQLAEIINYTDAEHVDIQFEDGTVVENKRYDTFKNGAVANPNFKKKRISQKKLTNYQNRVGETRKMNNGLFATIIRYNKSNDIDVQFEDKSITKHKSYESFKSGQIGCSNYNSHIEKIRKERIGQELMMNCGMKCKIIKYERTNNITVQFEDGTIVENKSYHAFIHKSIQNPKITILERNKQKRIGLESIMNCGMKCKIIDYINHNNIIVEFEDKTVVKNKCFYDFQKGLIKNPNL